MCTGRISKNGGNIGDKADEVSCPKVRVALHPEAALWIKVEPAEVGLPARHFRGLARLLSNGRSASCRSSSLQLRRSPKNRALKEPLTTEGTHTIPYYIVLYYTMLYYTMLYYTILYYAILYCTILYYTILYYTILYYTILYCTIACCSSGPGLRGPGSSTLHTMGSKGFGNRITYCIYIYIYVCMYVCMCVCVCVSSLGYSFMGLFMLFICLSGYLSTVIFYLFISMYVYIYICVCVYTHTYIHTHTHA